MNLSGCIGGSFASFFIAAIFMCIGGVFFAISFDDMMDYRASSDWQTANGEVLFSRVETSEGDDGTTYRAYVRYFYYAGDQRYEGDRLSFGWEIYTSGSGDAYDAVEKYSEGTPITVYYDPNDPAESVVERRLGATTAFFVIGAVLLGIGVLILIAGPALMVLRPLLGGGLNYA